MYSLEDFENTLLEKINHVDSLRKDIGEKVLESLKTHDDEERDQSQERENAVNLPESLPEWHKYTSQQIALMELYDTCYGDRADYPSYIEQLEGELSQIEEKMQLLPSYKRDPLRQYQSALRDMTKKNKGSSEDK